MKRAREDVAELNLNTAAELIGRLVLTSGSTISRLEALRAAPSDRVQRARAYLACLVYGVDPAELGLTPDDLPTEIAKGIEGGWVDLNPLSVTDGYAPLAWWNGAA